MDTLTRRRYRVNRGFGHAPRFVMATSNLFARLFVSRYMGGTP